MIKRLVLIGLLVFSVLVAGCIQQGDGGIIISFNNESHTIPITTNSSDSETYDCTGMELELVALEKDEYAGFVVTSMYYVNDRLISDPVSNGISVGTTQPTKTKCGYTVYITVHRVTDQYAVIDIHTEPSNPGWDGENIVMYKGDVLRVSFS